MFTVPRHGFWSIINIFGLHSKDIYKLGQKKTYVCNDLEMPDDNLCMYANWPRGYKTFFKLNSVEHEIFLAHQC